MNKIRLLNRKEKNVLKFIKELKSKGRTNVFEIELLSEFDYSEDEIDDIMRKLVELGFARERKSKLDTIM